MSAKQDFSQPIELHIVTYCFRSPLSVRLGDTVRFDCSSNISEFERITRLVSIRCMHAGSYVLISYQQNERVQYDSCNCTAGGQTCEQSQLIASLCLAQSDDFPRVSININRNSGMLNSVLEYVPGETYYFTSKKGLPKSQPGPMSQDRRNPKILL